MPDATADPALMERVWINLLSNAVKYSLPSARHAIEASGEDRDGVSVYSVRDYGVGFDQRNAGKLFRIFQRLHDVGEFEGTGLGLAIVKRIVSRHGGEVWAEGRPGEGSTFYFSLPRRAS
jgi:light-regulated signal transduction histidine kinase (bacteriophytochrome)